MTSSDPDLPPPRAPGAAAPPAIGRIPTQTPPLRLDAAIYGALTVLFWAAYNVAAKEGIDEGFRPADLSLMRFGVGGLVFLPLLLIHRFRAKLPPLRHALALMALGGPLFAVLATSGYQYAPLSHGLLFAPAAAFIGGAVLGVLWLGEKVGRRHWLGGAVMLSGLVVLSGFDAATLGPDALLGDLLFVATGSTWSVFTALMRKWRVDPLSGTVAVGALSFVVVWPVNWLLGSGPAILEMPQTSLAIQAVCQGLIGGVGSFFAYFAAVNALGAARASLLPALVPGTALLVSVGVLGVEPRPAELAGIALATLGLFLAARPSRRGAGRG
ncbi:MAG: DMT family transporter [Pseudomonadota bacterium]